MPFRKKTLLAVTDCPVASTNFDTHRLPVDFIVLHTEVGFKAGTRATFAKVGSGVSAHYGVNLDGTIDWFVDEDHVAYHCGIKGRSETYNWNQRSIGIETEDLARPYDITRTEEQYTAIAALVAEIALFHNIPLVLVDSPAKRGIILHKTLNPNKGCPGNLDVSKIIQMAISYTPTLLLGETEIDKIVRNSQNRGGVGDSVQTTTKSDNNMQKATTVRPLNTRTGATTTSQIVGSLPTGTLITLVGAVNGEAVSGNSIWYKTDGGLFVWSGGVRLDPIPQPTDNQPTTEDLDESRAGKVIREALPTLETIQGGRFGNAEGAAREMTHNWNNLITARKQAKGIIESLQKLFGL